MKNNNVYLFPINSIALLARNVVAEHCANKASKTKAHDAMVWEIHQLTDKVEALSLQVQALQRR